MDNHFDFNWALPESNKINPWVIASTNAPAIIASAVDTMTTMAIDTHLFPSASIEKSISAPGFSTFSPTSTTFEAMTSTPAFSGFSPPSSTMAATYEDPATYIHRHMQQQQEQQQQQHQQNWAAPISPPTFDAASPLAMPYQGQIQPVVDFNDIQQPLPWQTETLWSATQYPVSTGYSVPSASAMTIATAMYTSPPPTTLSPVASAFPLSEPMSRSNSNASNASRSSHFTTSSHSSSSSRLKAKSKRTCGCGNPSTSKEQHKNCPHQSRPYKCVHQHCSWKVTGFSRIHDARRHSAQTHWVRGLDCPFCPALHTKVDVFRKHLQTVHQVKPRQKCKTTSPEQLLGVTTKCGVCQAPMATPQNLHDHIQACILWHVEHMSETEITNAKHLSSVENDANVKESISKSSQPHPTTGRKKKGANKPNSWGEDQSKMTTKQRTVATYNGQRKIHSDQLAMRRENEVMVDVQTPGGTISQVSDLDTFTIARTEAMHSATEEDYGPINLEDVDHSFFQDFTKFDGFEY